MRVGMRNSFDCYANIVSEIHCGCDLQVRNITWFMWIKPPFCLLVYVIIFAVLVNYRFYRIWFHPKAYYESERKRINQKLNWFPMHDFLVSRMNDEEGWIRGQKIISIFGELFVILWIGLPLAAWFLGKWFSMHCFRNGNRRKKLLPNGGLIGILWIKVGYYPISRFTLLTITFRRFWDLAMIFQ